jgi:hypothetical protein
MTFATAGLVSFSGIVRGPEGFTYYDPHALYK